MGPNAKKSRSAVMAFCLALASAAAFGADAKLEEAMSQGGLQKVTVKGVELAYARPGAKLSRYTKVMVEPVQVAFASSWKPKRSGSSLPLAEADRERIRMGVAKLVHEEFVRELQAGSGYRLVESAGADVLRVKPEILNLYVSAADSGPSRARTYVASAGQMTLLAELIDSETHQIQARVVDRREARRFTGMKLGSAADNEAEARVIAAGWAKTLRSALDRSHAIGGK